MKHGYVHIDMHPNTKGKAWEETNPAHPRWLPLKRDVGSGWRWGITSKLLILFIILIYCLRVFFPFTVGIYLCIVYLFLKKNLHWETGAAVQECQLWKVQHAVPTCVPTVPLNSMHSKGLLSFPSQLFLRCLRLCSEQGG